MIKDVMLGSMTAGLIVAGIYIIAGSNAALIASGVILFFVAGAMILHEEEKLQDTINEKQVKIDELMLEYCPEKMFPQQIENWEKRRGLLKEE